jgi:hypothetical protein
VPVFVVPYTKEGRRMRDVLLTDEPVDYLFLRNAQRYIVSVREPLRIKLADQHVIVQHESGLWAWATDADYSPDKGMSPETVGIDPTMLTF